MINSILLSLVSILSPDSLSADEALIIKPSIELEGCFVNIYDHNDTLCLTSSPGNVRFILSSIDSAGNRKIYTGRWEYKSSDPLRSVGAEEFSFPYSRTRHGFLSLISNEDYVGFRANVIATDSLWSDATPNHFHQRSTLVIDTLIKYGLKTNRSPEKEPAYVKWKNKNGSLLPVIPPPKKNKPETNKLEIDYRAFKSSLNASGKPFRFEKVIEY
jgi:hypothetical protein